MDDLRPVSPGYYPGYPRLLSQEEIDSLLKPGILKRFSREALLAGTLTAGVALAAAGASPAATTAALPRAGISTRTDPRLKADVERLVKETLAGSRGNMSWHERASIQLRKEMGSNPPVKYPMMPIMFGNSLMGVFDAGAAREAARKLFALYGIDLARNVTLRARGYEFTCDGFNEKHQVGFELIQSPGGSWFQGKNPPPEPASSRLDDAELKGLDAAVKAGKIKVFVAKASGYPNMDNDLYTPMQYYLASVVDYLNWVHGDRKIDPNIGEGRP